VVKLELPLSRSYAGVARGLTIQMQRTALKMVGWVVKNTSRR
jgi:hypothetical protein